LFNITKSLLFKNFSASSTIQINLCFFLSFLDELFAHLPEFGVLGDGQCEFPQTPGSTIGSNSWSFHHISSCLFALLESD
jgi:hypothetical protein